MDIARSAKRLGYRQQGIQCMKLPKGKATKVIDTRCRSFQLNFWRRATFIAADWALPWSSWLAKRADSFALVCFFIMAEY